VREGHAPCPPFHLVAALVTFRHRVAALVGLAALALLTVTVVSLLLGLRSERQVADVELRYVPLLEVNRDLTALFTAITRALADAASAAEEGPLAQADRLRDQFIARVHADRAAIASNGGDPDALLAEFAAYYGLAREVSAALIGGDATDELAAKVERMHAAQARCATRLDASTTPDRRRLAAAFASARRTQRVSAVIELSVAALALVVMLLLSWAIVRRATGSLRGLSQGMERLARGDFSQEILVDTRDEFGDVAEQGNQTARRLREYRDQSEREDWLKTGVAGLAAEIAGHVDPRSLARQAMAYLARQMGADVAVVYLGVPGGFRLEASLGADVPGPPAEFRLGETQLGQAAQDDDVRVLVTGGGEHTRIRTAVTAAAPAAVVIVPIAHEGRGLAVLELAFAIAPLPFRLELLRRARRPLGLAFRVAESQERTQALLEETQRQSEELREAYDTVEARNRTLQTSQAQLQAQQEELRHANEELAQQAAELEAQRAAVQHKNGELERAHRLLEERAAELTRTGRYKSEFLANMSHELRTPLNSIMILSQILADNEGGGMAGKQIEFAQIIHKSGEELLTLINDVLDLSKVEAGKQELVLEDLPVAEIAGYVQRMFGAIAADKGLGLEVTTGPGVPAAIQTDRTKLTQILKNLVSNALKFTARGRVAVAIEARPDERIAVRVSDTGIGIAPEKQQWVFEAFAQAEGGTSRAYGGTGLGLSIARKLASLLGGQLTLDSQLGVGSSFELVLPVAGPDAAAAPPIEAPASPPPLAPLVADDRDLVAPGDPCLLVIEDNPGFASLVLGLIREAGFRGLVATTGADGVALAERYRPTGIVLDLGLPDVDGWSIMERLQKAGGAHEIPVHVMTASGDVARATHLGAVGFSAKPVSAPQIRGALRRLEAAARGPVHRVLLVEPDPAARAVAAGLLAADGIDVDAVASAEEATARLAAGTYGGLVQELAAPDRAAGFALLARARELAVPAIVHTGLVLSPAEIRRIEDDERATLIVQGDRSPERLLEETRLFLHHVRGLQAAPPAAAAGQETRLDGKRVLIVDDDMRNVYSLSSALRARHLDVFTASDGEEALAELDAHPDVDAVLMDVMMPRMDGHEATRRIRAQERFRALPIIALTAKTMADDRAACLAAGASDFVPKPVDVDRLVALLRVWLVARPADLVQVAGLRSGS
jgi:signal transduction histidine kinase/DNA-binding response OmpR family regulator/HAMP domain-containing protein